MPNCIDFPTIFIPDSGSMIIGQTAEALKR